MLFAAPAWLWLLPLSPALALVTWRKATGRRTATTVVRGLCVASAVLALARPMAAVTRSTHTHVTVLDLGRDAGVMPLTKPFAGTDGENTVVVFANRAEVLDDVSVLDRPNDLAALRERLSEPVWQDDVTGGSNLADALRLAGAQVPAGGRGDVRLWSAGTNHHGDAAAEAWRLARRGIAVRAEPLPRPGEPAVRLVDVRLPAAARIGQSVTADVTVVAKAAGEMTVRLTAGDGPNAVVRTAVTPGLNRIAVNLSLIKPGLTPVHAAAWADGSDVPTGQVVAAIDVGPSARVTLVQDIEDAGVTAAFASLLGPSAAVTAVSPDKLEAALATDCDAVVLADVPADSLPAAAQSALRDAVSRGTGLLVAGAARSFGPGGYDDSQLAPLLPVKMPQQMGTIDPSTTLALVIDTSGSMGGPRIDLAKEVARLMIEKLRPHDKVGIVEFYGGRRWAAPLQSAGNQSVIQRALARLTVGGGTKLYPAVEEAAFAMRNVRTRSKHVVIISDGFVERAPFGTLVRQMADDGVAVSTVQVTAGEGTGGNMMPDIARWGNGRYYVVPDEFALPDISLKQPQMSLTSPLVHTPADVLAGDDALVRAADDGDFGRISGFVRTQAKPTTDVLLKTDGDDPLLARWRYGAGYVAAMPTQLGSTMAAALQERPAFARLLADLVRQIGGGRGMPLRINAVVRPGGVEADVVRVDPDPRLAAGTLRLVARDASGEAVRTIGAESIGPGHWNVLLPDMPAGAYTLTAAVNDDTVIGRAGVAVAPPAALATLALVERLNGFAALAADRAAALPADRVDYLDLQKALAVAAAVLLVLHVAVRRWPSAERSPVRGHNR